MWRKAQFIAHPDINEEAFWGKTVWVKDGPPHTQIHHDPSTTLPRQGESYSTNVTLIGKPVEVSTSQVELLNETTDDVPIITFDQWCIEHQCLFDVEGHLHESLKETYRNERGNH